jgi:ribosomal protein S27AE
MPDATSIIATLAATKHSIDVVKAVKDADYDLDKAILKEKIAILVDSLLEAKIQAGETLDLIQEKDKEIAKLEDLLSFKNNLCRKDGKYYELDSDGKFIGEPYCPKCWEVENIPVHLKHIEELRYVCPNCENAFGPTPKSWIPRSTSYYY